MLLRGVQHASRQRAVTQGKERDRTSRDKENHTSTHRFQIIIAVPSWPAAALSSDMSLLTASSGAEIRAVGTATSLVSRLGRFLLKGLHLAVQLRCKLLILVCELADSVLGNPVVPLLITWLGLFLHDMYG